MVKMGVQYSLWGGSVVNLGTERHREKYFDDIDSFRLPGCGSGGQPSVTSVRDLAPYWLACTTATYCITALFNACSCFAMTELRHGSNVAGLQTEAMLDVATDEWVVHTPDEGAIKASAAYVLCRRRHGA